MKSIFQKITVQKVVKGFRYLKHYGWKEFIIRLQEKMEAENVPYEPWYEKHKATAEPVSYTHLPAVPPNPKTTPACWIVSSSYNSFAPTIPTSPRIQ